MARSFVSPIALGLLLLGATAGSGTSLRAGATATVNNITDEILAGIETFANDDNLSSLKLPDLRQAFSLNLLWILSINGWVKLTGGTLTNFQKVNRYQASYLTFLRDEQGIGQDQIALRAGVELPNVVASYDFEAKVGVLKQHGKVRISLSGTKAKTLLHMFMDTLKPAVVELKVADLGKIDVKVQDGVLGWLASGAADVVARVMSGKIKTAVETKVPPIVNELLDKLDIASMLSPPSNLID